MLMTDVVSHTIEWKGHEFPVCVALAFIYQKVQEKIDISFS